jgi:membrane protein required for colicin V production
MNSFDLTVGVVLMVAVVAGFRAGLLRSGLIILGYLLAMPIAVWLTSLIVPQIGDRGATPPMQNVMIFFAVFLATGIVLGMLLRMMVNDLIGSEIGLLDRLGGAALGAVRVLLIAVTMVLIFDQLIPPTVQPAFLAGSQLRPILSVAGQKGLASLPPETVAQIEQLKRDHHI